MPVIITDAEYVVQRNLYRSCSDY